MAYIAPYIDAAGLHIPSYIDIRDDLAATFKQIYGQDIYLENDSQDYQMIAAFALKTYDTMQLLQIVYNNRSPKTAVGSALDGVVKLSGIRRKAASYSTCVLTLQGEGGATIKNGVAEDNAGVKWILPEMVVMAGAAHRVTAVCEEIGAIEAAPGSITRIVTPTKGWISVVNDTPAVVGAPVETDEELRARQSISVAIPSRNMTEGALAGIRSLPGVKRCKIYDNDSGATDANGIPGHTIAAVVEGGLDAAIAEQIYLRKGPGCGSFGDVAVDYINEAGQSATIRFFRPVYAAVDINLTVKRNAGYTINTKPAIEGLLASYIDNLDIGDSVTTTGALAAILPLITNLSLPIFSVAALTIGRAGKEAGAADIAITFKEIASAGTVTVTEV